MSKATLPLSAVFSDQGIIVRGSGEGLLGGVGVRACNVIPDERGRLGEIMRADDPWLDKFGQVYFTTTLPGVVKAWHYHEKQTDLFYAVSGTLKIALYDMRGESPTKGEINMLYISEHAPALVRIPAGIAHGWMNVGPIEAIVINTVSEAYDPKSPDEFRIPAHDNEIPFDWTRQDG